MVNKLSKREVEVLELISQGQRNVDIAQTLGISIFTVQNHVCHILVKLGVNNRAAAARKYWEQSSNQHKIAETSYRILRK